MVSLCQCQWGRLARLRLFWPSGFKQGTAVAKTLSHGCHCSPQGAQGAGHNLAAAVAVPAGPAHTGHTPPSCPQLVCTQGRLCALPQPWPWKAWAPLLVSWLSSPISICPRVANGPPQGLASGTLVGQTQRSLPPTRGPGRSYLVFS